MTELADGRLFVFHPHTYTLTHIYVYKYMYINIYLYNKLKCFYSHHTYGIPRKFASVPQNQFLYLQMYHIYRTVGIKTQTTIVIGTAAAMHMAYLIYIK